MGMLRTPSFLVFFLISMAAAGMMQFYFLGTAQFMQDNGIASKNVPAAMAIAQATQAAATLLLLGLFVGRARLQVDTGRWVRLHGWCCTCCTSFPRPPAVIVVSQAFHGLAYVFFIIAGQMFAGSVAPEGTGGSMQALIFTAQSGLGLFLGTQLAGVVMDRFRVGGQFQWRKVWMVPGAIMLVCVLALVLFFRGAL